MSSNFAQLPKCHLSLSLPFSFSVSLSFAGLAGIQEWLSVAKPNRSSQIHNTPSALSRARGEQLLIFQRTLHYHSGQKAPGVNTEALSCHARLLQNIHTFPPHCIDCISKSTEAMQLPSNYTDRQRETEVHTDHFYGNIMFQTLNCDRNNFLWCCIYNQEEEKGRKASHVYSRINFEHKVFLLFEVCDGVENIAHGKNSAAIRSSVLHMRWAFL